jgi:hypothetical protein
MAPNSGGSDALTIPFTFSTIGNVLVVIPLWASNLTARDTSMTTGGANIPTFNGTTMAVGTLSNSSRSHAGIYTIAPAAAGTQDVIVAPASGWRSGACRVEEWTGVDITTPLNIAQSHSISFSGDTFDMDAVTTDVGGVLIGGANFGALTPVPALTVGSLRSGGESGGDGTKDFYALWSYAPIPTAGVTQHLTHTQTGQTRTVGIIAELNPA